MEAGQPVVPAPSDGHLATVFLSYSRADSAHLQRIAQALSTAGFRPNYDRATPSPAEPDIGISVQDEWWLRVQDMIVGSEVMVLLVSTASARSRVVGEEIAFARGEGKRIIPVLCGAVDFTALPPALAALHIDISFADAAPEAFADAMRRLCAAINEDIDWLRMGRTISQKCAEWTQSGRTADRLLHGAAIGVAEQWSARRPGSAPPIGEAVLAFIAASRHEEELRSQHERERLARQRRMKRWIASLIVLGVLMTLVGASLLIKRQRQLARSESLMYARMAEEWFIQGDHVRALRASALGLADGFLHPGSPEAEAVFRRSALSPVLEREFATSGAVDRAWVSDDGSLAAFHGSASSLGFWDMHTGAWKGGYSRDATPSDVGFAAAPQGLPILSWGKDLQHDHAVATGEKADVARFAELWTMDGAGQVRASSRRHHPVFGALFVSGRGPIFTWGRSDIALWSADLKVRIGEAILPGPIDTARSIGDGERVLVLLDDGRAQIRSVNVARPLALLASFAAGAPVRDMEVLDDGKMLLLVTVRDELIVLDAASLALRYRGVAQLCCSGTPQVAIRKEQAVIVTVVPQAGARLVGLATGEPITAVFPHTAITGARLDPAGVRLVTYGRDQQVNIWDVGTGKRVATAAQDDFVGNDSRPRGPPGGTKGAEFIDNGMALVVWNEDGTIRVYDSATGKQLGGHMRHPAGVYGVLFLPGRRLLTLSEGPVRLWRLPVYAAPVSSREGLCSSPLARIKAVQLARVERGGAARSVTVSQSGQAVIRPAMVFDAEDVRMVPMLQGREGDTLCKENGGP